MMSSTVYTKSARVECTLVVRNLNCPCLQYMSKKEEDNE